MFKRRSDVALNKFQNILCISHQLTQHVKLRKLDENNWTHKYDDKP